MHLSLLAAAIAAIAPFAPAPQGTLQILDQAAIETRLEQLRHLVAPLRYQAEIQQVELAPRHVALLPLREQLDRELAAVEPERIEEFVVQLLEQAKEQRPPSYLRTLCSVTWSEWRHVVQYQPEWPGQVAYEDYIQTEDRNAGFQPSGKMLRFERGTRDLWADAALSELLPNSLAEEDARTYLTKVMAWTQRPTPQGARLLQAKSKDRRIQWLLPADDDRPRAWRGDRRWFFYRYHPENGRLSQVILLTERPGTLQVRRVQLSDHQLDPPASQFVLPITTPQRIVIPSDLPAEEVTELPEEWKGLVVVTGR